MLALLINSSTSSGHAVVLEKCTTSSFQFRNSYQSDPTITIPKNRKTFYQDYMYTRSLADFNTSSDKMKEHISKNCTHNIEWAVDNDWILFDEGYSLQFSL